MAEQIEVLEDHADADGGPRGGDLARGQQASVRPDPKLASEDADGSIVPAFEAIDAAQKRALAGAARAEKGDDLADPDCEVQRRQDGTAVVGFRELVDLDRELAVGERRLALAAVDRRRDLGGRKRFGPAERERHGRRRRRRKFDSPPWQKPGEPRLRRRQIEVERHFQDDLDKGDRACQHQIQEEHRIVRRANAILLLGKGWSYAEVAEALFLDNSTIRIWLKEFQEGGVEAIVLFDLKGGTGRLSPLQIDELRAWATEVLPTSITEIGQFILDRFGFDYGRSGLIKLMNRIGFDWKKPEIRARQDRRGNPAKVHRRA